MRKILAIMRKDILLRFSSPSEWLFFLILPLLFTFLLSGGTGGGNSDARSVLPVVDEAQSELSAQILAELEHSTVVRPQKASRAEAESRFSERKVAFWLLIPEGVTLATLREGSREITLYTQPNNLNALAAQRSVQSALRKVGLSLQAARLAVQQAETRHPFSSAAEREAYFDRAMELATNLQRSAPSRLVVNQAQTSDEILYDPKANSSAGQLITWVFIPLLGISALFAAERNAGTLARLITTPTSRAAFLLGTIGGQVAMALVQMLLLVGFGVVVLGVPWGREPLALMVLLVAAALAAGALGCTLGTIIRSDSQANNLSILLGMVMALLGGCWYPLELFPAAVQQAVKVLPTTWAMQGMIDLTLRGEGLAGILPEVGVLLGFAGVFLGIGVWRFYRQ
ncbi:MAG TPA: ABC transporter permease [Anaerolinea thermolimosa]|uniref:ABC transporter permease n=1 Tax=Anaerolinea thermolimosa TaxID=229919 RepID=A0A3D1JJ16_9CHLR|nr:ABC transporter permease [Anaerolinea thermolimosa]GAP08482.1 ABC-type multidrug transport system, permease component [Anaerolinea thermolimosa]HCE17758.1 ABC transporter permease [Anaerolinea thermolimosa]